MPRGKNSRSGKGSAPSFCPGAQRASPGLCGHGAARGALAFGPRGPGLGSPLVRPWPTPRRGHVFTSSAYRGAISLGAGPPPCPLGSLPGNLLRPAQARNCETCRGTISLPPGLVAGPPPWTCARLVARLFSPWPAARAISSELREAKRGATSAARARRLPGPLPHVFGRREIAPSGALKVGPGWVGSQSTLVGSSATKFSTSGVL